MMLLGIEIGPVGCGFLLLLSVLFGSLSCNRGFVDFLAQFDIAITSTSLWLPLASTLLS